MLTLNPCYLYTQTPTITLHRNFIVMLMIFDLLLLLGLRIFTIFFRNEHKQRVDDILRRGTIEKEVIRVEEINANSSQKTADPHQSNSQAAINGKSELANKRDDNQESESSSSSNSSANNQQIQPLPNTQKFIIDLKQLRMTEAQLQNTYCIDLGHKFICWGFVLLYYPFWIASTLALSQSILKIVYYILRLCGSSGKIKAITNGCALLLNLPILFYAIYGLSSRVPDANNQFCFDL